LLTKLFKDSLILSEENLDDKLTGKLSAPDRPSVVWIKNIHSEETEVYTGKIERTSLSLWLQERASRKMASPDKKVEELTSALAKTRCDSNDANFCVIGVYANADEKKKLTTMFESAISKYKDDPVKFYITNLLNLNKGCPAADMERVSIYRPKRSRFEPVGASPTSDQLYAKIDSLLSGAPLANKITSTWQSCFKS
jgi:hypothetical protein